MMKHYLYLFLLISTFSHLIPTFPTYFDLFPLISTFPRTYLNFVEKFDYPYFLMFFVDGVKGAKSKNDEKQVKNDEKQLKLMKNS